MQSDPTSRVIELDALRHRALADHESATLGSEFPTTQMMPTAPNPRDMLIISHSGPSATLLRQWQLATPSFISD
jgi:hypothetical protein